MYKNNKNSRAKQIKTIEYYLRNYQFFQIGVKNMQQQLDYIMPNCTAHYDLAPASMSFNIESSTERYAIDRIESKRALELHEEISRYELIIKSIDTALPELDPMERKYVEVRYFKKHGVKDTADELGYNERYLFVLRNHTMNRLLISLKGLLQL